MQNILNVYNTEGFIAVVKTKMWHCLICLNYKGKMYIYILMCVHVRVHIYSDIIWIMRWLIIVAWGFPLLIINEKNFQIQILRTFFLKSLIQGLGGAQSYLLSSKTPLKILVQITVDHTFNYWLIRSILILSLGKYITLSNTFIPPVNRAYP